MHTTQLVFRENEGKSLTVKKRTESKVHFIHYRWDPDNEYVVLHYYDRELMQFFHWVPEFIDMNVMGPRKCIGFYQYERYHPCIIQSMVDEYPQCLNCVSHAIPIVRCIFEPECNGNRCTNSICGEPHRVYIAFFNTRYKVGMTSERRLKIRINEQGADAYTCVATVPDRLSARKLEKAISSNLGYRESYEPEITLRTFTEKLRTNTIKEKYELVAKSLKNKFGLKCSELIFFDNYPLKIPLRSMPKLRNTIGLHKGKVIGVKGKFLVYENNGLFSLRLDELLGNYMQFHREL